MNQRSNPTQPRPISLQPGDVASSHLRSIANALLFLCRQVDAGTGQALKYFASRILGVAEQVEQMESQEKGVPSP